MVSNLLIFITAFKQITEVRKDAERDQETTGSYCGRVINEYKKTWTGKTEIHINTNEIQGNKQWWEKYWDLLHKLSTNVKNTPLQV